MEISSMIIIGIIFIVCIILIVSEKVHRVVVALGGAVTSFLWLYYYEDVHFGLILDFIFGTIDDGYTNFHSLIMIFGMMVIISISNEGGLFQFLSFKLIQMTKGAPVKLLVTLCLLSVITASIIENILAAIVLIPLTITVSRILHVNPLPFILTQAILINLGGTMFPFSSIPDIMIVNYSDITFIEFFLNMGIMSIIIVGFSIVLFVAIFKKNLKKPQAEIEILLEFNVWNFVQDRKLMFKSMIVLVSVIVCFIIIPQTIIPMDTIALIGSIILLLICKLDIKTVLHKIDYELLVYLIGIFALAGALEYVGIINMIGEFFLTLSGGEIYSTFMIILWSSAYIGANLDNIPITRILLPVIDQLTEGMSAQNIKAGYYALAFGANWGDNLTPLGDNIIVMNLCEQNKFQLSMKEFFKLGFITTNYQLGIVTIYYSLILSPIIGIELLAIGLIILISILTIIRFKNRKQQRLNDIVKE